jgi:hypothetical protein
VVTITAPWKSDPLISPRGLGLVMTITAMMITMMEEVAIVAATTTTTIIATINE